MVPPSLDRSHRAPSRGRPAARRGSRPSSTAGRTPPIQPPCGRPPARQPGRRMRQRPPPAPTTRGRDRGPMPSLDGRAPGRRRDARAARRRRRRRSGRPSRSGRARPRRGRPRRMRRRARRATVPPGDRSDSGNGTLLVAAMAATAMATMVIPTRAKTTSTIPCPAKIARPNNAPATTIRSSGRPAPRPADGERHEGDRRRQPDQPDDPRFGQVVEQDVVGVGKGQPADDRHRIVHPLHAVGAGTGAEDRRFREASDGAGIRRGATFIETARMTPGRRRGRRLRRPGPR